MTIPGEAADRPRRRACARARYANGKRRRAARGARRCPDLILLDIGCRAWTASPSAGGFASMASDTTGDLRFQP